MLITVPVECTQEPGLTGPRTLHVRHVDCQCTVSEAGQKVGKIAACIGGGVEVEIDGHVYYIAPEDVFVAVQQAHRERLLVGKH